MKSVVLEIKKNKAVTLSDDGMVKEITNKNYRIGQTIEMERNTMNKMNKKYRNIAAGIAASLVIMLGGGTAYAYTTPVAHVSLDVNPAMTFEVNSFNRVIEIEILNKDAEEILLNIDWEGKNINTVIKETISALKENNYLENEEWYSDSLMITVNATSPKKGEQLELGIKKELAKIAAAETVDVIDLADFDENVIGVGAERVALAAELGVTPGRLNLVQKLFASDPKLAGTAVTSDTAILYEGSVKEIMAKIKGNKEDSNIKNNGNNGNGNGNGNGNINANENANANKDMNNLEREMELEKERNEHANQNRISPGAIENEDEDENEDD